MNKSNSSINKHGQSVWSDIGQDKIFESYRSSTRFQDLKNWVDKALFKDKLIDFLDKDFVKKLKNEDFYGRLWELEISEWLSLTKLKINPTKGVGPDFCIDLKNGSKIWIEVVLARPDKRMGDRPMDARLQDAQAYKIPNKEVALRYSSSLVGKADKIKKKYSGYIGPNDCVLIAISAFPYSEMWPDLNLFMPAILPIEFQVVYFSKDRSPLDESMRRPTHSIKREYEKESGSPVKKEFLYPGNYFPYIDGVIFSEASNLQQLLGRYSTSFNDSTNRPHIFPNYVGKALSEEFTRHFYYHKFNDESSMVTLKLIEPID